MESFDAIVVGVGGMGSAALYHLARRGMKVLGIDPFGIPNDKGSSHGETRIIRKVYFEHPDYVPLLHKAFDLWHGLEAQCGQELFRQTGLLEVGLPEGVVISGVKRSSAEHRLFIESIPIGDVSRRFPGFVPAPDMEAMFEAKAGLLYVERCVEIHAAQARLNGAKTVIGEAVRSWTGGPGEVRIETDRNRYVAASAVFCAGPWSDQLLRSIGIPLTVRRKPVIWYPTRDRRYSMDQGCPVFCFDTADGFFYGLPTLSGEQLKVAEHTGGEGIASADELDRTLHPRDESRVNRFVRTHLPDVVPTVAKSSICMYTMTPDQHFVIDRHPDHPNVVFAAGFSGHGFKFAPIVGSILADMVESGRTEEPIEFLSLSRAALRDSRPDRSKV